MLYNNGPSIMLIRDNQSQFILEKCLKWLVRLVSNNNSENDNSENNNSEYDNSENDISIAEVNDIDDMNDTNAIVNLMKHARSSLFWTDDMEGWYNTIISAHEQTETYESGLVKELGNLLPGIDFVYLD